MFFNILYIIGSLAFRHDMANATGAFSQSTAALSSVEEAHSLSRALAHLSRVEEKVEQVHRGQAEADTFHLFDLIKDYVALIGAIRSLFFPWLLPPTSYTLLLYKI